MEDFNKGTKAFQYGRIAGSVGFAAGVAYGFKVSSGFWKGWGYAIIGSIALGGIGMAIGGAIKDNSSEEA
jgi:hypothetical protein